MILGFTMPVIFFFCGVIGGGVLVFSLMREHETRIRAELRIFRDAYTENPGLFDALVSDKQLEAFVEAVKVIKLLHPVEDSIRNKILAEAQGAKMRVISRYLKRKYPESLPHYSGPGAY